MKKGLFILIGIFAFMILLTNLGSANYCLGNIDCESFNENDCVGLFGFCEWYYDDIWCYPGGANEDSCSYFSYDEESCITLDYSVSDSGCTWESGCLDDNECDSGQGCAGETESCSGNYYTDTKLYWDGFTLWNWVANAYYTVIGIDAEGVEMTVTNIGCDACSQDGLHSYRVTSSIWYEYTCWKPAICVFGNTMEWRDKTYKNPAYTSVSCSEFSEYDCGLKPTCSWNTVYGVCVDYDGSEEVCTDAGYDWEQPFSWLCLECGYPEEGKCCGDDGINDIGETIDYAHNQKDLRVCKVCEATVVFEGVEYFTAGEYAWAPTFDVAETSPPPKNQAYFGYMTGFDDDCDGLEDEDIAANCDACQDLGGEWCINSTHTPVDFCTDQATCTSYGGTIQASCCITTQTCVSEGHECGSFYDDCGNFHDCYLEVGGCAESEFCISNTCTILDDCDTCVAAELFWCDDSYCNQDLLTGCTQTCPVIPPTEPSVYWANIDGEPITTWSEDQLPTIKLKLLNSGLANGTQVSFDISERDAFPDGDDDITTLTAIVQADESATVTWDISLDDLNLAMNGNEETSVNDPFEFYFEVESIQSEDLIFEYTATSCSTILRCMDYDNPTECDNDFCGVGNASVVENDDSITCGAGYDCECTWDIGNNVCEPSWNGLNGGGTTVTGTCTYIEDTSGDDCENGFLTYGWQGVYSGEDEEDRLKCETTGISTAPCPAQIELPFFGTWGIVITIALIVLIYLALNLKKQKHKVRKRKK